MMPIPDMKSIDESADNGKLPMATEKKMYVAFVIAVTSIFVLGVASYISATKYAQVTARINRVLLLRDATADYFDAMQDAETGQRGFLLTDKQPYLEPYDRAIHDVNKSLSALDASARETQIGVDQVLLLGTLTSDKIAEMKRTIELRRMQGFDAARDVVLDDSGKSMMDQIRRAVASLQASAFADLRRLEANSSANRDNSIFFALFFVLVTTALLIFAARTIIVDLRKRERLTRQLNEQANRDLLTNLPNRRYFLDMASYMVAHAKRNKVRAAIMFIDLDGFKKVNDTRGHEVGDKLLIAVAKRFASTIRETDLLARLGGDEFAVLIHEVLATEELAALAARLIDSIRPLGATALQESYVGASIGIAVYPENATTATNLLDVADQAMYMAKQSGKNRFRFFSNKLGETPSRESRLRGDIAKALDNNEFSLVYQPIVEVEGGRIVGAEALLRWQHPEMGVVAPDEFIPIAERTGLIVPIGAWVLSVACQQLRRWLDEGIADLYVAVNVASQQWRGGELGRLVDAALTTNRLPARSLEIEITENVLLRNVDETIEILRQLSDLGVRIAIDDFGTGYSSLSYLRHFKLDTIKIDQSFVGNMLAHENDATIVRAIIALAHSMKMNVVAEGVESTEQKEALAAMGCDEWQGYLSSSPLAADKFEQRLLAGAAQA